MPSAPEVVEGPPDGAAVVDEADDEDEPASPSTLIALPDAVTGTETAIGACAPESTPPAPLVDAPLVGAAGAGAALGALAAVDPLEPAPPTALTAFPVPATGTERLTSA